MGDRNGLRRFSTAISWLVLHALLVCCGAAALHAETFNLRARVYCKTAVTPCGFTDVAALRSSVLEDMERVNRRWQPNGISFRPVAVEIFIGTKYSNLNGSSGDSDSPLYTNPELFNEMQEDFANQHPGEVALFLVPDLSKCWSSRPWNVPNGDPRRYGAFCEPASGDSVWAHELGHHFCLSHTFTKQDTATHGSNVNWDGDRFDSGAGSIYSVADTRDDPSKFESYDPDTSGWDENASNQLLPQHEWCEAVPLETIFPVDQDSWGMTFCGGVCTRTNASGIATPAGDLSPMTSNAMSYWGRKCRGPYTVFGVTHEAFTPDQRDAVEACRANIPERQQLNEVCGASGDSDSDGWCDFEDSCPNHPNTAGQNTDSDGDGLADACDPCVHDPNNLDTDGDGIGNHCGDFDDDDDGCFDWNDQHPLDKYISTNEVVVALDCPGDTQPSTVHEGIDSDGDSILNCMDLDDDGDGIPDDEDPCPFDFGEVCVKVVSCPVQNWWNVCLLGGCNEYFTSIESLINPDPTRNQLFQQMRIENQTLYLTPNVGSTISQQLTALVPETRVEGFASSSSSLAGTSAAARGEGEAPTTRIAIRSKRTMDLIAVVADYGPEDVALGEIQRGTMISIHPDPDSSQVRLEAVWDTASHSLLSFADRDGDGIPDPYDNCLDEGNPDQRDTNRDGLGNRCDADFDGDRIISQQDLDHVEACDGFLVAYEHPFVERDLDDQIINDPRDVDDRTPREREDDVRAAAEHAALWDCEHADLDGDGLVSVVDLDLARGLPAPEPTFGVALVAGVLFVSALYRRRAARM